MRQYSRFRWIWHDMLGRPENQGTKVGDEDVWEIELQKDGGEGRGTRRGKGQDRKGQDKYTP